MNVSIAACCLGLVLAADAARADVVERRGNAPSIQGKVTEVGEDGVKLRSDTGAEHFVPWDRVREVRADAVVTEQIRAWRDVRDDLWRARTRVERYDTTLAEPLLGRLFERYRGQTHETALVVAEGLLRCRLARADHALAVVPALEVARLRRAGVTTDSYAQLSPVIDEKYAVSPLLAPVWLDSPLLNTLERELASYDAQGDEVVGALAILYRRSLDPQLAPPESERLPDHPGVDLLSDLLETASDDPARRSAARERLERARAKRPAWAEAWSRFYIGMSMVAEDGLGRRHRGLVQLIHLPARFGRSQPFLVGLALARAAEVLEQTGDSAAADTLRAELARSYPDHPVHRNDSTGPV